MKRAELIKTLGLVRPALSDGLVPVFSCFVFEAKNVYAYNDAIGITGPCDPGIGPFATNGKVLLDLLNASGGEEVTFTLSGNDVGVKAGKSSFKLPFLGKDDFIFEPPDTTVDKPICSAVLGNDLINGLEMCLVTAAKDYAFEALMGVTFSFDSKGLTLYSCDGDAITRYKVDGKTKGAGRFTVSNAFCEALVRAAKETGTEKLGILINQDWAIADLPNWGVRIHGRMRANDEPMDHETMIKDTIKGKQQPVPIPEGLNDALIRATVIADKESALTRIVVSDNATINLLTESSFGTATDKIPIPGHGACECAVHASLILRTSRLLENCMFSGNCCVYSKGSKVLVVCSNPDDNS